MKRKIENIRIAAGAKHRGMIMPLVATIMVFIFLLGIAMLRVGFGSRFTAARTSSEISARSAADAGLAVAMFEIKKRGTGMGVPPAVNVLLPNSRASYSYTVTPTPNPAHANTYTIRSVGTTDKLAKTVYAATWATSFWSFAIAVDDTITFHSKMTLDVYDPDGEYPGLAPTIGTTSSESGAITLFPNTEIPGDVVVGPGSNPDDVVDSKASSTVHGDIYAADSDIDFPPVTVPGGLEARIWDSDPCSVTITTGGYAYMSSVTLGNGNRLDIVGDVVMYVAGSVRLHQSSVLNVQAGSSLTLYLGSWLTADQGSVITNVDQDARDLRIYGTPTCTSIDLKNSGNLWAAIYAPNADLLIHNSGDTYGAFIGNSFDMRNSAGFHYDARLLELDPTNEPRFFIIQRWWERGDDVF